MGMKHFLLLALISGSLLANFSLAYEPTYLWDTTQTDTSTDGSLSSQYTTPVSTGAGQKNLTEYLKTQYLAREISVTDDDGKIIKTGVIKELVIGDRRYAVILEDGTRLKIQLECTEPHRVFNNSINNAYQQQIAEMQSRMQMEQMLTNMLVSVGSYDSDGNSTATSTQLNTSYALPQNTVNQYNSSETLEYYDYNVKQFKLGEVSISCGKIVLNDGTPLNIRFKKV